jgi:hypothetical protein
MELQERATLRDLPPIRYPSPTAGQPKPPFLRVFDQDGKQARIPRWSFKYIKKYLGQKDVWVFFILSTSSLSDAQGWRLYAHLQLAAKDSGEKSHVLSTYKGLKIG